MNVILNNSVTSKGNYNNIPTSLTSNVSTVNMISGLTLTIDASQKNWATGYLTYTVEVNNETNISYESPVITDVIDDQLVTFIEDSVTVNGSTFNYDYNTSTHTLTVNLPDVLANSKTTLTFQVEKKS